MFNTSKRAFAKPFVVTRIDGLGEVKILNSYETHAEADAAYDHYCNKFPNACIDLDDLRSD